MERDTKRRGKKKLAIGSENSELNQQLLDSSQEQSFNSRNPKTVNNNFNSENIYENNNQKKKKQRKEDYNDQEKQLENLNQQENQEEIVEKPKPKPKFRLTCLDIFRGLTMTGMILVDDQGYEEYSIWPVEHSAWSGWTTADQVFPNFLFIMGLAIPFAIKNQAEDRTKGKIWFKVFKRGILLFVIGLVINMQYAIPSLYERSQKGFDFCFYFRIFGIMQRLGICYIIVTSVYLINSKIWKQLAFYLLLISIYAGFMYAYPVPTYTFYEKVENCKLVGEVVYDCNGVRGDTSSTSCNFEGYLDAMMLGPKWDWDGSTRPTDPEGPWGYLTSVFNTFMGLCTCLLLQKYKKDQKNLLKNWAILGLSLACFGFFLNSMGLPLNKSMWSISFMFATAGVSLICLIIIYLIVDIILKGNKCQEFFSAPFIWLGMNPLFIYVVMMMQQTVLGDNIQTSSGQSIWDWCAENLFYSWTQNYYLASMLNSLAYWLIWVIIAGILYRFKIFIKL